MECMDFWIKGDTFEIKDDLKSLGCRWDPKKRLWKIHNTNKEDSIFITIKQLGCELIPIKLSPECQKIQTILNKK